MEVNKKYNDYDLKKALARRHKKDMFFTEVKDGPTHSVRHHSKIDALSISLSWLNFSIIGYEIKVSRSDFLRDEKWRAYLPMCNQLYFAVAPGVCDPAEVPDVCGLVTMTAKGGLRIVRKAPWREIDEPVNMYKYLMFTYLGANPSGSRMTRAEDITRADRLAMWRDYLDDKETMREIGRRVGGKFSREMQTMMKKADMYDRTTIDADERDKALYEICKALGIASHAWRPAEQCLREIERMKGSGGITTKMEADIKNIHRMTGDLVKAITPEGGGEGAV
ncbi:MAG: MmcB family DNA repair protein [Oscillospiraceae bacterium]|nr:MmcB family DNA repair protein [Oscillospiraceae bacterium]